jgi:large subunit ribosomal protein L6
MVIGVSEGYKRDLELVGVGFKAQAKGQMLELSLGFSHNIVFMLPEEVKVETLTERGKNPTITLTSVDKQLVGQIAAKIRSLRKPEPYKGKGVLFKGEVVKRKSGKAAAS